VDFNFSEEEKLLQWAVKDFAGRELAPKQMTEFDGPFRDAIRHMGSLGFLGVTLPELYGGDPANWVMLGIVVEEIARVNACVAYFILVSHEVASTLAAFATEETKQKWLPGLIQGGVIGCISATEPGAGTDFGAIQTRADNHGDRYLITGTKGPVSFGMRADMALTFATTGSKGGKEATAFAIPLSLPGINRFAMPTMGLSASAPASLIFDGTSIPTECRIGEEGEGRHVNAATGLLSGVNQIASALIALGVAQTALLSAVHYSKERTAFGRPIGKFEAISQKIAENMTFLEAGRWLCYRALSLKDRGIPHAKEAAMCGWWCPKISCQAIQDSLLIHGHSGYCDDHPFQQMLRDVVAFELISGTEQMLKLVIGKEAIGPTGVPDCLLDRIGNL
jgi:cyclohexanecarboxyl-CoA dehydrogenase